MKKNIFSILIVFILLAAIIPSVAAAADVVAYYTSTGQPMVSNQFYSVVFDGEGEAAVLAKINIVNLNKGNFSEMNIEIPGQGLRIISIVQEYAEMVKDCSNWDNRCAETNSRGICTRYEQGECLKWYYRQNQNVYYPIEQDVQKLSKSYNVHIKLPKQIQPQERATVVVYYKAMGYANKGMTYNFDFETIKVPYDIDNARVAVNVGAGLYLKGGASSVSYLPNIGFMDKAQTLSAGVASSEMSSVSRNVEYQQGFVKTGSSLDPLESFHVTGKYAKSTFLLYGWWILLAIIITIAAIIGLILLFRKLAKIGSILKVILSGLFSSIALVIFWFVIFFIMKNLSRIVGYRNNDIFALLFVIIGILVTLLILFGPPIYLGIKYGAMMGLWAFVSLIVWLFIVAIIAIVFFAFLNLPSPVYYATSAVEVASVAGGV